jgi:hypothetical protein
MCPTICLFTALEIKTLYLLESNWNLNLINSAQCMQLHILGCNLSGIF